MPYSQPFIPEAITVHLGLPTQSARNVTVPFTEYIKNVASSEIYPTWPEAALRANILAEITFALNRVYTEWYRCRGYDFDITNSTQFDQSFIENRSYYDNISVIVDEIFNNYVVREGHITPLFAQYCNGTTSTCPGLSQWGTVTLANEGLTALEILRYYYGDDIYIIENAPVQGIVESYPGVPLRLGDVRNEVRTIQVQLNRIAQNYPAIPLIPYADGIFGIPTEQAVRTFQRVFNLVVDGIVGKATWYKIKQIYNAVMGFSELESEAYLGAGENPYPNALELGDLGSAVQTAQYYLGVISYYDEDLLYVGVTGEFDEAMRTLVEQFQEKYGLPVTGRIDRDTWTQILVVYQTVRQTAPNEGLYSREEFYSGRFFSPGITGEDVSRLQRYINLAAENYSQIPSVSVTGSFDEETMAAVRTIQELEGALVDGFVGAYIWSRIVALARNNS